MRATAQSAWARARFLAGAAVVLAMTGGAALVGAFQAQGAFVKVPDSELARQEVLPSAPLLMTAYAFVWTAIFVYVFLLWRRLNKVERELATVSQSLRDRAGAPARRG